MHLRHTLRLSYIELIGPGSKSGFEHFIDAAGDVDPADLSLSYLKMLMKEAIVPYLSGHLERMEESYLFPKKQEASDAVAALLQSTYRTARYA